MASRKIIRGVNVLDVLPVVATLRNLACPERGGRAVDARRLKLRSRWMPVQTNRRSNELGGSDTDVYSSCNIL